jgi:uncharacterized protein YeaO (DUF488 family)
MATVKVKRIYAPQTATDGCRVLVDRLWPRGLAKEKAAIDHWLKDLAPSNELRRWYGHDPDKWDEFRRRYRAELDANPSVLEPLLQLMETEDTITLLFSSREEKRNNAVALAEILNGNNPLA